MIAARVGNAGRGGACTTTGRANYHQTFDRNYVISQGNYVLDSFTIGASATVTGVTFVAWPPRSRQTSTTLTSIDWAIFSGLRVPYGADGPLIASGTSAVTSTLLLVNTSGYAVNTDSFAIPATQLASGTYSLALASAQNGVDTYPSIGWDVNFGPSTAVIRTNFGPFQGYGPSNAFQILGSSAGAVPEPASWALLLAGFAATGVAARRRRISVAA